MRKITFLITTLCMTTIGLAQNLLTGGDLEGLTTGKITPGSSPWDTSVSGTSAQSSINNNNTVAYAGDQFINMPNDFTNFRQPFTATASTEYTLSLWNQFNSGQGQPDATDGIFISIRQNTGGNGTNFDPVISYYIDPSTLDANWNEITFDFIAPQSDLLLFITKQTRAAGGPNNAARMDNISITEKVTLSANDLLAISNFSVSPNPANNIITLSAQEPIDSIEVYSILGHQVMQKTIGFTSKEIDISRFSSGIYIVKAFIGNSSESFKLIKK